MLDAREDFLATAVRVARDRGLRLWKDDHTPVIDGARSSLAVLLKEKENIAAGEGGRPARMHTGVNASWVLDIWEAALEHLNREDPFSRRREAERTSRLTAEELEAMQDGGPQFIQVGQSLSARILDAYLGRDDEAIMRIAIEIEGLEAAR